MAYILRRLGELEKKKISCGTGREFTSAAETPKLNAAFIEIRGATKLHYHAKTIEAYYVLRGELDVGVDGKTERLKKGDFLLISPNTKHKASGNADILAICAPAWTAEDEILCE